MSPPHRKWLMAAASKAEYLTSGHLLFVREQTLLAQPFDTRTFFALSGEPVAIAGEVLSNASAASANFAASADGSVLTYDNVAQPRLAWFDRGGVEVGSVGARGSFSQIRLSPDGSRVALVMPDPHNGNREVWMMAVANGVFTRLTTHRASDWFPVWSSDGTALVFATDRDATPAIYRDRRDRRRRPTRLSIAHERGRLSDRLVARRAGAGLPFLPAQ